MRPNPDSSVSATKRRNSGIKMGNKEGRNYKHRGSRISIFPDNILFEKRKVLREGHILWLSASYTTAQQTLRGGEKLAVTLGAYNRFRWQFNGFVHAY